MEGPPYPDGNIFYNRTDIENVSEDASRQVHQILKDFRATRNIPEFIRSWNNFRKTNPEYKRYKERIEAIEASKESKEIRFANALNFGVEHMSEYIEYRAEKDKEEKCLEEDRYKIIKE